MLVMNTIKKQQGLAAVEFAIVVPVMLFLMLATAEFGRVFYQYNTLTKAVQAGARYASRPGLEPGALKDLEGEGDFVDRIQNMVVFGNDVPVDGSAPLLDNFSTDDSNVRVTSSNDDGTITIQVNYQYTFSVLGDLPILNYVLPTLILKASAVTDTSLG